MQDLGIFWRRQFMKFGTFFIAAGGVDAIEHDRVEVHMEIQGRPKTLHKRDGATLRLL